MTRYAQTIEPTIDTGQGTGQRDSRASRAAYRTVLDDFDLRIRTPIGEGDWGEHPTGRCAGNHGERWRAPRPMARRFMSTGGHQPHCRWQVRGRVGPLEYVGLSGQIGESTPKGVTVGSQPRLAGTWRSATRRWMGHDGHAS